ncbi:hypothetical protein F4561_006552 [Lipingzhangella halophila]|uniref:Concanavalin A-like lectin/glucanase superfamily protein n=1 Tax=Lipingzhangella halophila TaxID=1783352 RepID=A0A7W7RP69_9ACTN|nr:hypothetical protein [Lipingzhangella halophila]MBB4935643.1 hypothetical protein [Lipingzhangella halophila]
MDFPSRIGLRVEIAFGANLSADPDTWDWTDVSGDVHSQSIQITRGRQDEASSVEPSSVAVELDNPDGDYTPRRPQSRYFPYVRRSTPLRISVQWQGEWHVRFAGEVAEWAPTWPYGDLSSGDYEGEARVKVTASGILRRLGQGQAALHSALRRRIVDSDPVGYWPLDDGKDTFSARPVVGRAQLFPWIREAEIKWADAEMAPWLESSVNVAKTGISSRIHGAYDTDGVTADIVFARSEGAAVSTMLVADAGSGDPGDPFTQIQVRTDPDDDEIDLSIKVTEDGAESSSTLDTVTARGFWDGRPHHLRLVVEQGGSDLDITVLIDGEEVITVVEPGQFAGLGGIGMGRSTPGLTVDEQTFLVAHLAAWTADPPPVTDMVRAMRGHRGETAGRRIERLCSEEGIALEVHGDLDQTMVVGPQHPETLLDLLQQAAEVDAGILYEARETPSLAYRPGRSTYNQGE